MSNEVFSGDGDIACMVIEDETTVNTVAESKPAGADGVEQGTLVPIPEETTAMVIGHGGQDKVTVKARAVRALELRREKRAEAGRVLVEQKAAQAFRISQVAAQTPPMHPAITSGGDVYQFRSMIAQPCTDPPNLKFNLDAATLAKTSLWDPSPEPVCDAIIIDGFSWHCTEDNFVNRVIHVVSCQALNITMDETLEARYRECLVMQYRTEWAIDLRKVCPSQGVSALVPLPCRLPVRSGITRTGLVWIMPGGQEGTSRDREAVPHHYNLIAAAGTDEQSYTQLDIQQAAVVYVIRGFSREAEIGDLQRKLLHRSLQQLEPDVVFVTERVATGTTSRGVMHEDLMVVMVVDCDDREEVADNLRLATDFTSTRDTMEWCSIVYERGATVATFQSVPQIHVDVPIHYCVTGLYNIRKEVPPSQIHYAIHMDNNGLPECSIGTVVCVSERDGLQTALVVWNARWERQVKQPCLDLRRGNIAGLAGKGKTVKVIREVEDLPGREAYSEMARLQPRYDDKTHTLVTGVVNSHGDPPGQVEASTGLVTVPPKQGGQLQSSETHLSAPRHAQGYAQLIAAVQEDKRQRQLNDININRRLQQVEDSGIQATQHINSRFGATESAISTAVDQLTPQVQQVSFMVAVLLRKAMEDGTVGMAELQAEADKWEAAGLTAPTPTMAPVKPVKYAPAPVRMTEMHRTTGTAATIEELESGTTLAVTSAGYGPLGAARQSTRDGRQAAAGTNRTRRDRQGHYSGDRGRDGDGQRGIPDAVVTATGMLSVPTTKAVAGQGPKGTRGADWQQTPFPLGLPPGILAPVTQTVEAGQEPWSPSDEIPATEPSVAVQALEGMTTTMATSPAGLGIVTGQEVGSLAQAIRSVFSSTVTAMADKETGSPLGLGNSKGAGGQTLEVPISSRRPNGQVMGVAKIGKATSSIPGGMETEI